MTKGHITTNHIKTALEKSSEFLIRHQQSNGSWRLPQKDGTKYQLYSHPIILTSQAINALVFAIVPEYILYIQRALQYCLDAKTDDAEDVDIRAWQLCALNYSNSNVCERKKAELLKWILSQQSKEGYWVRFPSTNYLTNYAVFEALKEYNMNKKVKVAIRRWLKSSRAKDSYGWGFNPNEEKSWILATADVVTTLLAADEDSLCEELQVSREYIENSQKQEGCWIGKFTSGYENFHATAAATLCLMLLLDDPFDERIEKGIKYLLSGQTENGDYPDGAIHTVRYANQLFSFYLYLKDNWNSQEAWLLKSNTKPQYVTNYYWKRFQKDLRQNLYVSVYKSIINSRVLGTTSRAVERRKDILQILSAQGSKTVAEIIDTLKEREEYKHLKKKSHLTQIKSDMEFLKDLKLVQQNKWKYYLGFEVF